MTTQPQLLDAHDAAAYLGIPVSTLRRETQRGHLPAKQIGRKHWYARTVLDNYAITTERSAMGQEEGNVRHLR